MIPYTVSLKLIVSVEISSVGTVAVDSGSV